VSRPGLAGSLVSVLTAAFDDVNRPSLCRVTASLPLEVVAAARAAWTGTRLAKPLWRSWRLRSRSTCRVRSQHCRFRACFFASFVKLNLPRFGPYGGSFVRPLTA